LSCASSARLAGDPSQKQIAQSLGYKDVASFARVFRKAVGSAPGAYRNKFGRNGIPLADVAAKEMASRRKKHIFEVDLQTG
jgi:AraC-like DNA-binding protein